VSLSKKKNSLEEYNELYIRTEVQQRERVKSLRADVDESGRPALMARHRHSFYVLHKKE
jgi:hypothetical protein